MAVVIRARERRITNVEIVFLILVNV